MICQTKPKTPCFNPTEASGWILAAAVCGLLLAPGTALGQDQIRPTGEVKKVRGGFGFTEGPAWDPDGVLYFTDIPNNTIFKIDSDDELSTFTDASNHANGLQITSEGRLLVCEMDGQLAAYETASGERTVLAEGYQGKRFNAPNDLVQDSSGGIYFTDPLFRAPEPLPQEIQAVYYRAGDGSVHQLTGDLPAPNGVGLSPDGKRLYVIPSRQDEMFVYDVTAAGRMANRKVLCRLEQPEGETESGGDGMAVDVEGNLYITSALGVQIFGENGQPRGIVEFPEQPSNVTFGGYDRKTMYVTARTGLYRVRMPIAGLEPN